MTVFSYKIKMQTRFSRYFALNVQLNVKSIILCTGKSVSLLSVINRFLVDSKINEIVCIKCVECDGKEILFYFLIFAVLFHNDTNDRPVP